MTTIQTLWQSIETQYNNGTFPDDQLEKIDVLVFSEDIENIRNGLTLLTTIAPKALVSIRSTAWGIVRSYWAILTLASNAPFTGRADNSNGFSAPSMKIQLEPFSTGIGHWWAPMASGSRGWVTRRDKIALCPLQVSINNPSAGISYRSATP